MNKVVGACGCICSDCRIFEVDCMGCYAIEGKACWLDEVGLDICDFYECSVIERNLIHWGECEKIPCQKFWMNKNPNWTDEQHKKLLKIELVCLKSWQTLGIILLNL